MISHVFFPQGASSPDPTTVYVDLRALRNDRVTLTERGAPHSLALMESGKLLPGVNVIIANPDTKGQCGDSHLGEVRIIGRPVVRTLAVAHPALQIWVQCPHNASGYFTIYGEDSSHGDHFNVRLVTGGSGEVYARTGYLGFLRRTEAIGSDGGEAESCKLIPLNFSSTKSLCRLPRRRVCGWRPGRDSDATGNEVPPDRHREFGHASSQEDSRKVRRFATKACSA